MELMIPLISQFQGYFGRSFISLIVSFIEADLLYINKLNICWSKWRKCNLFCYLAVTSLTNNTRNQCRSPCFGYHTCVKPVLDKKQDLQTLEDIVDLNADTVKSIATLHRIAF